jgi:hypothetical protein
MKTESPMSSRLSDLVSQALEANTVDGRTDAEAAKIALRDSLTEEHVERALSEFATRLIATATRKTMAEFAAATPRQGELPFRLHAAYAVDLGERRIVNTYDMTRIEANQALKVRRDQIDADTRSANDLERAIRAADPHWDRDPSLTFGQSLERAAVKGRAA